jgi:hypothetical protein
LFLFTLLYKEKCIYKLAEIGIPLGRFSEDKARVNKYGHKLVELCKRCSLYIDNDRVYKDKFIGRSTCKDLVLELKSPANAIFL